MADAEQIFIEHLDQLKVPIFVGHFHGITEFARPKGWQNLDAANNWDRIESFRPGQAIMAVMGGNVACVDIDPATVATPNLCALFLQRLRLRRSPKLPRQAAGRTSTSQATPACQPCTAATATE